MKINDKVKDQSHMKTIDVDKVMKNQAVHIKKLKEEIKSFRENYEQLRISYQNLMSENVEVIKDRQIYRDALVDELKVQLSCKANEFYTPIVLIQRMMNTISKAKAFGIYLK